MDGRAASQTVTDKIPFLIEKGIKPVVLSGVMGYKDTRFPHLRLLPMGPSALKFDLRFVLRKWVSEGRARGLTYQMGTLLLSLIFMPFIVLEKLIFARQSQWSWAFSAYIVGLWTIRRYKLDCIYVTGGSYSAQSAGIWLKRTTGLPLLVEVHDPLVFRGKKDARLSTRDSRYQAKLEGEIAQHADLAWWFTRGALASAQARHVALLKNGIVVIPGANPPTSHVRYQRTDKLIFAHFGTLANARSLNRFIEAFPLAIKHIPAILDVIQLHIYGGALDHLSKAALNQTRLQMQVKEWGRLEFESVTGLTGREQVMQKMQRADVLLLPHGEIDNCAEYIPSKLYEYFWAERPVFGLTHKNESIDTMILERGGYCASAINVEAIAAEIVRIYQDWKEKAPRRPFANSGVSDAPWQATTPPLGVGESVGQILQAMQDRGIERKKSI